MHDSIIFNLREVWYDEMAAVIGMLYKCTELTWGTQLAASIHWN